jgi:hypothetical protein
MIDEPPWPFLMTSAQHRQWARILHAKGKPEKARLHEQLARAIEIVERRQAEHADRVPPFESSGAKKPRVSGAEFRRNVERPHMRDDRRTGD